MVTAAQQNPSNAGNKVTDTHTYFLVNDTRYDNHFGGLTVIRNLHAGMSARGWRCTGSLPVSSSSRHLLAHQEAIRAARQIIINGEGSLHHNSRNTRRLLDICKKLFGTHPLVLVNAVWQDNDPTEWVPLLREFRAVYARDRRSRQQLQSIGVDAQYAPDLTFYDYPSFPAQVRTDYLCTDSVNKAWTTAALETCRQDAMLNFITLFTASLCHRRGPKDWHKAMKYRIYPLLQQYLKIPVPPRYRSLPYAEKDIAGLLRKIASCRAICTARYHALCFAMQQNTPFVAVASNSHKSEALLEEAGIPASEYMLSLKDSATVKTKLEQAEKAYSGIEPLIRQFNHSAKDKINRMFDHLAGEQ